MKTQAELQLQRETDRDILEYVREMQKLAPVELESIYQFLTGARRKRLTRTDVQDRLMYLGGKQYLKETKDWKDGEVRFWTIESKGMDLLDGAIPPEGWQK